MRHLPPRYEPLRRLGAGGGGEVWSVRDRVSGQVLAFKVLATGAGEPEASALVREAVALSGLEGLGVPRVVAFGALSDGRRYMVRDLVEGKSLDEVLESADGGAWAEALASACDQLTVVHRAGLLHGDIKPANVIVGPDGHGTLVDLGLAAPWREGGTAAQGLTPKYAAPELLQGEPLTVRAEVYALGATLREALNRRGSELAPGMRDALADVAARAKHLTPTVRFPSVDELASALRAAAGLPPGAPSGEPPWPVLGLDRVTQSLLDKVDALAPGGALILEGPAGAGKTTLTRRLAWTLGARGCAVAFVEAPRSGIAMGDVVAIELAEHAPVVTRSAAENGTMRVIVVDDAELLDGEARSALAQAAERGARLVIVGAYDVVATIVPAPERFVVPPLEAESVTELVRRSVPSLPDALRAHLLERTASRPGPLRAAIRRLRRQPIVSKEDIDAVLDTGPGRLSSSPPAHGRLEALAWVDRALDRGRFDEAAAQLDELGEPRGEAEQVRVALDRARVALGRGDTAGALDALKDVEGPAERQKLGRALGTLKARAHLRAGAHAEAASEAQRVIDEDRIDSPAADALSVRGLALAFTGDDAGARQTLDKAIQVAEALGEPRMKAVAHGSAAIAHQRAGRTEQARADYEASLAAAERAEDAATVAAMRLNLASLAHAEGDIAQALVHLEAAVDMGQRAGSAAAVTQALLNLANLDLYLGRWARARGSIEQLAAKRHELAAAARPAWLGLEAEHAARTTDAGRAAALYENAALAWEAQGRPHDAAESRLEGLLARARAIVGSPAPRRLASRSRATSACRSVLALGAARVRRTYRFGRARAQDRHRRLRGDEAASRRSLVASVDAARKAARSEWTWQALDARARLAAKQGSVATARRDTEAALTVLEETAAKLPRDLREVLWYHPRRRALRQARPGRLRLDPASPAATSPSVLPPARRDVDLHGLAAGRSPRALARSHA